MQPIPKLARYNNLPVPSLEVQDKPSELLKKTNGRFKVVSAFGKVVRNTAFMLGEEIANRPSVVKSLGSIHLLAVIKIPLLTAKTFEDYRLSPSSSVSLGIVAKVIEKGGEFVISGLQLIKGLKAAQIIDAARFPWTSTVYNVFGPIFGTVVAVPIFNSFYKTHKFSRILEASKKVHPKNLKERLNYISERTTDKKIKETIQHLLEIPKNRSAHLNELAVMENMPTKIRNKARKYIALENNNTSKDSNREISRKAHNFIQKACRYEMKKFFNELEQETSRKKMDDTMKSSAALADTLGAVCLFTGAMVPCSVFMAVAAVISFVDVVRPKEAAAPAA